MTRTFYGRTTIAGQVLYGIDGHGTIWKHDLASVDKPTVVTTVPTPSGAIAADATSIWTIGGYGGVLYHIDPTTGARTTITTGLPPNQPASALLSVGDYLYASLRSNVSPYGYTILARISKSTGAWLVVSGMSASGPDDGGYIHAQFSSITGMAVDGPDLLISDGDITQTRVRIARTPQTSFGTCSSSQPPIPLSRTRQPSAVGR